MTHFTLDITGDAPTFFCHVFLKRSTQIRDDPSEVPNMVVSNDGKDCKLKVLGDNIFGALQYNLTLFCC